MNTAKQKLGIETMEVVKEEKIGLYTIQVLRYVNPTNKEYAIYVPAGNASRRMNKPKVFKMFKVPSDAVAYYDQVKANLIKLEESKAARRKEKSVSLKAAKEAGTNNIKVGDVFRQTFGYNMTLNTFYQVIGKVANTKLKVIEIGSEVTEGSSGYHGREIPKPIVEITMSAETIAKILDARITGPDTIKVGGERATKVEAGKSYYFNRMD